MVMICFVTTEYQTIKFICSRIELNTKKCKINMRLFSLPPPLPPANKDKAAYRVHNKNDVIQYK